MDDAGSGALSDADLVIAAKRDPGAFGALYQRYQGKVLRYCYYCLGDWDEAADATQQTFTNAFANLRGFESRGDSFCAWLFRIARNEVLGCQRRRRRWPGRIADDFEIEDPAPTPEDLAIVADDHARLRRLLTQLPPSPRRVCELRFAGVNDKEIAAVLAMSDGSVRASQSRAVKQLRVLMGIRPPGTEGGCA